MKYCLRFFKRIDDYEGLIHTIKTDTKPYVPHVGEYIYFGDLESYIVSELHTYYDTDSTYTDVILQQVEE